MRAPVEPFIDCVAGNKSGKLYMTGVINRVKSLGWLFVITVVVPTTIAIFYFGLFASDVYISESRFVVRSPEKQSTTGLGFLLKGAGFSNAGDEIYAAQDFIISRDALTALNRRKSFEAAFGHGRVAYINRFGTIWSGSSFEDLYRYFRSRIGVDHDATSSITTLTVRAYSPRDAQRFNEQLLEMAEATVNRLNTRGRQDLIRFASAEVQNAKEQARAAALALAVYRNQEGVVDPEKQATVQLQMISKLQDELIATKTQLVQLRAFAPANPQIAVLETRAAELSREIDAELGKVAGDRKSLAATAVQYQRLALETEFMNKQLAAAMTSLEEARNEARRKQAYVERIVQPNLPDDALEPRRMRGIAATFAMGLIAWGVASILLAGVKEHHS